MNKVFLFVSIFFLQNLSAQTIEGIVHDASGSPIAFADVVVKSNVDTSVVKVGYTEEDGSFALPVNQAGEYFMYIAYVGQDVYSGESFSYDPSVGHEIGTIQMSASGTTLDEVTVRAKKPLVEVLPDKTKFNVEGSINAQGSDAFELLRKAPGVVVDNNDNISLMGKNGVRIYINGRPSPLGGDDLASFLKSLTSDDIASIDIITNPSARYEAEGNAGIIDIRLKKNDKHGANATVNLGFNQGITPKGNASITSNYRNDAINVYGNYSFRQGIFHNWADFYREQTGYVYEADNEFKRDARSHNARVGMDYSLNEKSTIGLMGSVNYADPIQRTWTTTEISELESGVTERWLVSSNEEKNQRTNLDFNLNYNFKVSEGSNFSIDLDYGRFDRESDSFQPNAYFNEDRTEVLLNNDYRALTPIDIDIYSFKSDFDRNVGKGKVTMGIKSRRVVTDNTYAFYEVQDQGDILDMERSNQFSYDEWVNAAYMEYAQQMGKVGVQVGLRGEYTISEGELRDLDDNLLKNTPRDYLDIFPSVGISYMLNRTNSFSFNYSRRIDRPNYQDLNPFEFKMSELSFRKGNAFLNPQYTNTVKLSHTYNYRLTTSLSYSYVNDFFAQLTDTINQEASFIMIDNLATQHVVNLNVSYPFSLTQWWNWYINVNGGYIKNKADYGEGKEVDLAVPTFNMYGQTSFLLPGGFTAELSGWYNAGGLWGGIFENSPMGGLDAGLQYKFPNERGSVKLSMGDLFRTMVWGGRSDFGAQYVDATGGWESRTYRVNVTYLFGNQKVKKNRNRKTGIDEEKDRMNSSGGRGN